MRWHDFQPGSGQWVVSVEWGPGTLIGEREADVVSVDGTKHIHAGLAEIDVELEMPEPGAPQSEGAIPVALVFPFDASLRIARGEDLGQSTVELCWLDDSAEWAERIVISRGQVEDDEIGGDGEETRFSIVCGGWADKGRVLPESLAITDTTFPSRSTSLKSGETVAGCWVFGRPGRYETSDGTETFCPGTQARPVYWDFVGNDERLLIASHKVLATSATIWDDDDNSQSFTVIEGVDGLGQTYSYVQLFEHSGVGDNWFANSPEDHYWVSWPGQSGRDPGTLDTGLRRAGSLLRELLRRSTLDVDDDAIAGLVPLLNRYQVGGYVDTDASPTSVLLDGLLPMLPIGLSPGPRGLRAILWRPDATEADAVEHLEDGRNCAVAGPDKKAGTSADVVNALEIRWAFNAQTGEPMRRTLYTPEPDSTDPDQRSSEACVGSAAKYGVRSSESVDLPFCWEASTAARVARDILARKAFIPTDIEVEIDPGDARLQVGAVVLLTCAKYHISRQVRQIVRWRRTGSAVIVLLRRFGAPTRDRRTTT